MPFTSLIPALLLTTADVSVKSESYRGWKDSYRISNGVVDLVVVPQLGRVMRVGFVNQKNLLWENENVDGTKPAPSGYVNYGGDKLWPAPQSLWNWPPDAMIDGAPHKAEMIPNGVRLTSPLGQGIRVRFIREITLDPLAPVVNFKNRMENLGPRQELAAWQVAQFKSPDQVVIPFEPTPTLSKGWHGYGNERLNPELHTIRAGTLTVKRDPKQSRKFGAFSLSGQLTAAFGSTVLHSKAPVLRGQKYPDQGSPLQVFTSPDPQAYVELEHTSPIQRMDNSESVVLNVTWRLVGP